MRNQRFPDAPVAPVGTTRSYTVSGGWQIASVAIDNPSGMWLELRPSYTLIPPNTLGRIITLDPRSQTVTLHYVNAPTGGVASAVTGGPISVQAFDEAQADNIGTDYTLYPAIIDLTAAIASLQTAIEGLVMGWGGANVPLTVRDNITTATSPVTVITAPAGSQLVIVMCNVAGGYGDGKSLYGQVDVLLQIDHGGSSDFASIALTAEKPDGTIPFPPGSMVAEPGEDVNIQVYGGHESPSSMVVVSELWYFLRPV